MIDEKKFKDLNIEGKNILKNNNMNGYFITDIPVDNIDNYLINSNLNDINVIK